MLALVAHDLRNPLSALQSNLGFVQSAMGGDSKDVIEAIDDGLVSCEALAHIVDNLDLFGQSLRGSEYPAASNVDLAAIAQQAVDRTATAAKSHGVSVEMAVSAQGPHVTAVPELLMRAALNLIRNAIQYGGTGAVVRVSCFERGGSGIVRIEDAGPRLSSDMREQAFTGAGQLSAKSGNNGRYSRGLGLYCARIAASACGGGITVADEDSGVNAFELTVPLAR